MPLLRRRTISYGFVAASLASLAALAFPTAANAGSAKIVDNDDAGVPACMNLHFVVGHAGTVTSTFKATMFGNVHHDPCKGGVRPTIGIDLDQDNVLDCRVLGRTEGTQKPGIVCGSKVVGPARYSINPNNNKQWVVKFHTKDLPGKVTKYGFEVEERGGANYQYFDDTMDSTGGQPKMIEVG
jgi:hypothetical protein